MSESPVVTVASADGSSELHVQISDDGRITLSTPDGASTQKTSIALDMMQARAVEKLLQLFFMQFQACPTCVLAWFPRVPPAVGPEWKPGLTMAPEWAFWLKATKEWEASLNMPGDPYDPPTAPRTPMYVTCSTCQGGGEILISEATRIAPDTRGPQ
jgi:hypothetical protein